MGREPRQEYCQRLLTQAQADVREWFRRRSHCGTNRGLAPVCCQGNQSSNQCGKELLFWRELRRGGVGKHGGDGHSNKRVERTSTIIIRKSKSLKRCQALRTFCFHSLRQ